MKQYQRKDAGFSPIEVLIAMAILAIGIMAVVKLFPSGLQFSRIAQERTVAAELADANLGRMRMTGAGNLLGVARAGAIYNTAAGVGLGTEGRLPQEGLLDGYATVVQRPGGILESKLVRVVFTVDLADGRRENFVTYVTDY
jgi:prepilin-type N-terminal cleavage/methylation domain-containing protein